MNHGIPVIPMDSALFAYVAIARSTGPTEPCNRWPVFRLKCLEIHHMQWILPSHPSNDENKCGMRCNVWYLIRIIVHSLILNDLRHERIQFRLWNVFFFRRACRFELVTIKSLHLFWNGMKAAEEQHAKQSRSQKNHFSCAIAVNN